MSVMDGRRLVRAVALGGLVFLLAGGGMGFALAAAQDADDALSVPAPRAGDRATYKVERTLLPDLLMGDEAHVPVDEVVYEWLPERTVLDHSFAQRISHPLRVTYIMRWNGQEDRTVQVADYDAVTGEAFHVSDWGSYTTQPTRVGGVTDPVDALLGGGSTVDFEAEFYPRFMAVPCAMRTPLHGAGQVPAQMEMGACGWPGFGDPTYAPGGWGRTPEGARAYRFDTDANPLLQSWFQTGSPFPVRFTASMREAIDPSWTVGRLFTLERTAWARGDAEYPLHGASRLGPADPVPLVPRHPVWMMGDAGLGGDFPLSVAYAEAEKAPRSSDRSGPLGAGDPANAGKPQPSVREWLAEHPDGYLAEARRWQSVNGYGQPYSGWYLLWVDGPAWLGKAVVHGPSTGDPHNVFLPQGAPERIAVSDWTPLADPDALLDFIAGFPGRAALPALVPSGTGVADRFLEWPGTETGSTRAAVNTYGFRASCQEPGPGCAAAGVLMWAGQTRNTMDATGGIANGYAITSDSITVAGDGLLLNRWYQTREGKALLGLGAPTAAETPPTADQGGVATAWVMPVAPAAATGISLLAVLAGVLYYFWPAVKGGAVGLFSRIESDRVLDHPSRKTLFALVEANPGIHFQDLARRTDFGRGQLEHHLRKLEQAGLVSRVASPAYTCFFARGQVDRRVMAAAPLLRSDGGKSILGALRATPGATSRQLALQLGLSAGTVSYHVKRLREAGLLESAGGALHLTETGRQAGVVA